MTMLHKPKDGDVIVFDLPDNKKITVRYGRSTAATNKRRDKLLGINAPKDVKITIV